VSNEYNRHCITIIILILKSSVFSLLNTFRTRPLEAIVKCPPMSEMAGGGRNETVSQVQGERNEFHVTRVQRR